MAQLRQDPNFKAQEQVAARERMRRLRQDLNYREKANEKSRARHAKQQSKDTDESEQNQVIIKQEIKKEPVDSVECLTTFYKIDLYLEMNGWARPVEDIH